MNTRLPMPRRLRAATRAAWFYLRWYPKQWLSATAKTSGMDPALKNHVRYAARKSKKLARKMFHAMVKHGPKLEREQMLLARFVDIGTELFAQTASATRAQALIEQGRDRREILALVDHFCAESRLRIERAFHGIHTNNDHMGYRLAQDVLKGGSAWLFDGIVGQALESNDESELTVEPQLEPDLEEVRS